MWPGAIYKGSMLDQTPHSCADTCPPSHAGALASYPNERTEYCINLCRSDKTIPLARLLFQVYGVHAWVPKIANKKPRKGEKRIKSALPGFVFIPVQEQDKALKLQKSLKVPQFRPLVVNGMERSCCHSDLADFEDAITGAEHRMPVNRQEISAGDEVSIVSGPFAGSSGTVKEVYFKHCLMVTIMSDFGPAIKLPAAFLG